MLTERIIRDAKPGPKPHIIWDGGVTGLGCKVFPSGRKAYVLSYRVGNRKRLATLARCSELSLREARERAGAELVRIRNGETDPLRRREQAMKAPTVNDGLDRFFNEYVPERVRIGRLSLRTVDDYRAQSDRSLRTAIGRLRIAEVTRLDIEQAVAHRGRVQRNRTLALASRLFTLFERWGWRTQLTNPVRGIERSREEPRDRVLAPSELAALAEALNVAETASPAATAAIRFATVTGLRIGEVRWRSSGWILISRRDV